MDKQHQSLMTRPVPARRQTLAKQAEELMIREWVAKDSSS